MVRRSLKQELQTKASLRDISHMKVIEYDAGKAKQVRKFPSLHPLLCLPTRVLEECAHCLRVELGGCRNRCGSTVSPAVAMSSS